MGTPPADASANSDLHSGCLQPTIRPATPLPNGLQPELISERSALIILYALVFGLVVGWLTFIAHGNLAVSVLAGLGTAGATLLALHTLIRNGQN
jgi:hypothetical protein